MVMFGYFSWNAVTRSASCFLAASSAVGSRPATVIVTGSSDGAELSEEELGSAEELAVALSMALSAASLVGAALLASAAGEALVVGAGVLPAEPVSVLELQAAMPPSANTPAAVNAVMRVDLILTPLWWAPMGGGAGAVCGAAREVIGGCGCASSGPGAELVS